MAQQFFGLSSRSERHLEVEQVGTVASVFEKPDEISDITFKVEGRNLHFPKIILSAVSPVFKGMFTADFKEKHSNVIPLPDKKFKDMDIFLQNIHPAHAWKPLEDDTLGILLRLADEYQIQHIRQKCEHYISQKILSLMKEGDYYGDKRTREVAKDVVFYLALSEQYKLPHVREELIQIAAKLPVKTLESDSLYQRLSEVSKNAILRARCNFLEQQNRMYHI